MKIMALVLVSGALISGCVETETVTPIPTVTPTVAPTPMPTQTRQITQTLAELNQITGGQIKLVSLNGMDTREGGSRIFVDDMGNIARVSIWDMDPAKSTYFTNALAGMPLYDGSPTGIQDARPRGVYHNTGFGNYGSLTYQAESVSIWP